ncbi:response regulator [Ascidiaceihabitans sp.]|uniref:response regulator n=1 Tax=Ascidiaceihabitans sp. TaxID=1872644 RepID=UPI00329A4904
MQAQTTVSKPRPERVCLVVEDNKFDQTRISRAMSHGCRDISLVFTDTLAKARAKIAENPFVMILLDNNLPDGMGADFAVELSKHPTHSKTPVVMVSDWPSPFMWAKATKAGVHYIVSKDDFHSGYVQSALKKSRERVH